MSDSIPPFKPAIGEKPKPVIIPRRPLEISRERPLTDCKCNSCKNTNEDLGRMLYGSAKQNLVDTERKSMPEVPSRSSIVDIDESDLCIPAPDPIKRKLVEVHDEFWKDTCWTSTSKNIFK